MNDLKLNIGEVRFSYVHVFQPEAITEGNEKKYSISLIIPKSNTELVAKIKEVIKRAYESGVGTFGGKLPAKGTWRAPLRDGDLERPDDEAYKNAYFINANSKKKPGIVKVVGKTSEGKPVLAPAIDEDEVYSGCYGFVNVGFFAYNNAGNKGIAAGLNNVLKTRDGEFLGGRASAESDFGGLDISGIATDIVGDMPEDDIY